MKKIKKVDFFVESKKWSRRLPKIKSITSKTLKKMTINYNNNDIFNLNLILSDKKKVIKLNKKFKNKNEDTDVLTFITKTPNKKLGNVLYCDIFFSIDTIDKFIYNKQLTLYDHFNHLLIHSLLHVNGYDHKTIKQFNKMKSEEIKILKKLGVNNPYSNYE